MVGYCWCTQRGSAARVVLVDVRERERERERGVSDVWGGSPVPGIACCANTNCVDTSERWAKLATQIKATAPA